MKRILKQVIDRSYEIQFLTTADFNTLEEEGYTIQALWFVKGSVMRDHTGQRVKHWHGRSDDLQNLPRPNYAIGAIAQTTVGSDHSVYPFTKPKN